MSHLLTKKKKSSVRSAKNSMDSKCRLIIELADKSDLVFEQKGKKAAKRFLKNNTTIESIRGCLCSDNKLARRKALALLTLLEPPNVISDLKKVLFNDDCPVVRHEAAYFLGTLRSKKALSPLCHALRNDPDLLVRHEAAEALGDLGLPEALPYLRRAKKSPNVAVRFTAQIAEMQLSRRI